MGARRIDSFETETECQWPALEISWFENRVAAPLELDLAVSEIVWPGDLPAGAVHKAINVGSNWARKNQV